MDECALYSMFEDPAKVQRALEICNGDAEIAMELLLSDTIDMDQTDSSGPGPGGVEGGGKQSRAASNPRPPPVTPPPPAPSPSSSSSSSSQRSKKKTDGCWGGKERDRAESIGERESRESRSRGNSEGTVTPATPTEDPSAFPELAATLPHPSSSSVQLKKPLYMKPAKEAFHHPKVVGGLTHGATPSASLDLDLKALLEVLGLNQADCLDADTRDYLVDVSASMGEDEAEALGLLQQFIPDLSEPSAAAIILAHLQTLAAAKKELQEAARLLETSKAPSTKASQKMDAVLFEIHQGHLRAKDPVCTDAVCTRNVGLILEEINENHPEIMIYANESIIEFVYMHVAKRNLRETLAYLLGNCSSDEGKEEMERRIEAHKRSEEEEEERKKINTRLVVEKFDEVEVRPKYDSRGNPIQPKKNLVMFQDKALSDTKTRYREGVAVVHNGAKYIVEKNPADDYDGGSRGKVKSKGKRGPGWV